MPQEVSDTSVALNMTWLRRYARLMDSSIRLPFGARIGLDGVIGLIPGLGDAAGALFSSVILIHAWRGGVSLAVMVRMLANVFVEVVIGSVPVIGDVFDMAFKANERNVRILERYAQNPGRVKARSLVAVWLFVGLLLALFVGFFLLVFAMLQWLVGLL
tara:strand:- start:684 stop:1160 length:477 start_codon:yes stop_codon:yes gene_type:complete